MPRKTEPDPAQYMHARIASMRPRPDAAENAKEGPLRRCGTPRFNEAAARCRGKPRRPRRAGEEHLQASMRPRPDAAENLEPGKVIYHPHRSLQ